MVGSSQCQGYHLPVRSTWALRCIAASKDITASKDRLDSGHWLFPSLYNLVRYLYVRSFLMDKKQIDIEVFHANPLVNYDRTQKPLADWQDLINFLICKLSIDKIQPVNPLQSTCYPDHLPGAGLLRKRPTKHRIGSPGLSFAISAASLK